MFNKYGVALPGVHAVPGRDGLYLFDAATSALIDMPGVRVFGKDTFMIGAGGRLVTGRVRDERTGKLAFYSPKTGALMRSGWYTDGGHTYYLNENGMPVRGNLKDPHNGAIYCFDDRTGAQVKNAFGSLNGKRAWFNAYGVYRENDWRNRLIDAIDTSGHHVSVYYKELDNGFSFELNDEQQYAASTVKVFVVAAVYEKIENGTLKLTPELADDITETIRVSSNNGYNRLVLALGNGDWSAGCRVANDFIARQGFRNTRIRHSLHPSYFNPMNNGERGKNYTSAEDLGTFMQRVYNGTMVNKNVSDKLLALLKSEVWDYIQLGVPKDVVVANKVGDTYMNRVFYCDDAGIVYRPKSPYVLSILIRGQRGAACEMLMKKLSSIIYYR